MSHSCGGGRSADRRREGEHRRGGWKEIKVAALAHRPAGKPARPEEWEKRKKDMEEVGRLFIREVIRRGMYHGDVLATLRGLVETFVENPPETFVENPPDALPASGEA